MFDYLGILISIILGLALTHLLMGLSRLIQSPRTVRIYWVQIVWTANVLIYVLAVWWGMFWWKHLQAWTVQQFLFLSAYAIVLFMLASMLFPHEWKEDVDFEQHFFRNKTWFFGIQLLAFLMDIPETLAKSADHLRDVPREYLVFLPVMIGFNVIGLVTANRRIHAVLGVTWLAVFVAYITLTALDKIVAA